MHEAYLKIWNHAADYQAQKGTPLGWMATILRNSALDLLRKHKRENLISEEPNQEMTADAGPGPLELLAQGQEAKALQHCLEGLQPEQRESITLAFWRGLSHQELARQMKKPLGTVKSWVRRGLERLKRCLDS